MSQTKPEKFETSLQKLETLVQKLEEGDLSLEDSLKAFEDGMDLVKKCETRLHEAQKKIEVLVKERSGQRRVEDFEAEE